MRRDAKIAVGAAAGVLATAALVGGALTPGSADEAAEGPDIPIVGSALHQASDAALAHTGGGTVTGTEVGDEESYYEVEVTLDDGTEVDVQLDESFAVVGDESDGAGDD